MKLPLFLMVFVYVHIHFWIRTRIRIRNPRVTDPAKVPDPCGSGSTTLVACQKDADFNQQQCCQIQQQDLQAGQEKTPSSFF
jgi:hypothetical protein